jgi:hypothetical protein
MSLKSGEQVRIKPLNNKVGRVVGVQPSPRSRVLVYLVRYQVEQGNQAHFESSLFFADELIQA